LLKPLLSLVLAAMLVLSFVLASTVQKAEAYQDDMHHDWTFFLALNIGFTWKEAWLIASGDARMDDYGEDKSPFDAVGTLCETCAEWHAIPPSLESENLEKEFVKSRLDELYERAVAEQDSLKALVKFGQYLHYYQDTFSHRNKDGKMYNDSLGHGPDGWWPDVPANRPELFQSASEGSLIELKRFMKEKIGRQPNNYNLGSEVCNDIQEVIDDIIAASSSSKSLPSLTNRFYPDKQNVKVVIKENVYSFFGSEIPFGVVDGGGFQPPAEIQFRESGPDSGEPLSISLGQAEAAAWNVAPTLRECANEPVVENNFSNKKFGIEYALPDGWKGQENEGSYYYNFRLTYAPKAQYPYPSASPYFNYDNVFWIHYDKLYTQSGYLTGLGFPLLDCLTPRITTISGVSALEYVGTDACHPGFKQVTVLGKDSILWAITDKSLYFGSDKKAYAYDFDDRLQGFDLMVSTLKFRDAVDIPPVVIARIGDATTSNDSSPPKIHSISQTLALKRNPVKIDIQSSSEIRAFSLDEPNKRLSFTVDGEDGTSGITIIPIATILGGPYIVTIDGEMTEDFELGTDASGEQTMTINYTHSTHEITITGTNVVPEFPISGIGAIAGVIGLIAILGRTRIFKPF
jgi:hypothetical protein